MNQPRRPPLRRIFVAALALSRNDTAAPGYKDEARTWYTRVPDLWTEADADVQPTVTRIRAAVAALGPPRN